MAANPLNTTRVVEFTDGRHLLEQLREITTGQKIKLRSKYSGETVGGPAIACDDEAAKTAYLQLESRERQDLNDAIAAELRRIQQVP